MYEVDLNRQLETRETITIKLTYESAIWYKLA